MCTATRLSDRGSKSLLRSVTTTEAETGPLRPSWERLQRSESACHCVRNSFVRTGPRSDVVGRDVSRSAAPDRHPRITADDGDALWLSAAQRSMTGPLESGVGVPRPPEAPATSQGRVGVRGTDDLQEWRNPRTGPSCAHPPTPVRACGRAGGDHDPGEGHLADIPAPVIDGFRLGTPEKGLPVAAGTGTGRVRHRLLLVSCADPSLPLRPQSRDGFSGPASGRRAKSPRELSTPFHGAAAGWSVTIADRAADPLRRARVDFCE
jgi:hypothetical protein